jgi:hypothetical protein
MYAGDYASGTYSAGKITTPTMYVFTTPLVRDIPNYLPDSKGLAVRLLRHYRLKDRGVNVYVLSDGTVVQDTATANNPNSGYPLPWILNDPQNEISYVTNFDGSISRTFVDPHISYVYYGGHTHIINQDERDFLVAAGYSDYITKG